MSGEPESVWDYPRPPRLERVAALIRVVFAGCEVVRSLRAHRVLETSHPPVYYVPPEDVADGVLRPTGGTSFCEWKGAAQYFDLAVGDRLSARAAWCYPAITPAYRQIEGHLAFYASRVDAAWVGDARVRAQDGDFYGGWITAGIVGPFKGPPGTRFW
ncbi:MAG: DUF427 domain-containing protein [Pikeienuella sp.]